MKKNGFTLVELLAVLLLIMLLLTITIPLLSNRMQESRDKATEVQINNIEIATKKYVTDNIRNLDELNQFGFINIKLKTLIEENYIEENLKNPKTDEPLFIDDVVYVTLDYRRKIDVLYDIDQKNKANIVLKGFLNDKIKLNSTYVDPGAIGFDGVNTNSNIMGVGVVDTSKEGVYTLEYSYQNSKKIKRFVIVTDDIAKEDVEKPKLICTPSSAYIETTVGNSYTMPVVRAEDNVDGTINGIVPTSNSTNINVPGTYSIKYNYTDSSGNKADTLTVVVIVKP